LTIFMDIEFVALVEAEAPDAFEATFDVIYAGETWCRSVVRIETGVAAHFQSDERAISGVARNALLELLATEAVPVSLDLRLGLDGITLLNRATPG
jgi:hypothetical protein